MNSRIREYLLGYLLGALDDDEQRQVERKLDEDPEWRSELQALQSSLKPLAETFEDYDPPAGLAERTSAIVADQREQQPVSPATSGLSPAMSSAFPRRTRFSTSDVVVAAGIFLAAAMMFFPTISSSRYAARLASCQNNLRQLGLALHNYSDKNGGGYFPSVAMVGNRSFAGIYGPILVDCGYLDPKAVICPASPVALDGNGVDMPSLSDIDDAKGEMLVLLRSVAGGSYGYNLGVVVDGMHVAPRDSRRPHFALMADTPNLSLADNRSTNHGVEGQNLLYEDGHVQFVAADSLSTRVFDHPFQNRYGAIEAGVDINDAVVAPSFAPPFVRTISLINANR